MTMKHTPGDWQEVHVERPHAPRQGIEVQSKTGRLICYVGNCLNKEDRANARFIVRACNAHDDLLAAIEEIAEGRGRFSVDNHQHAKNTIEDMKKIAEKAIAKTNGA